MFLSPWRWAVADFCYQCTEHLYGTENAPNNDFAISVDKAPWPLRVVLCEGCGTTLVDAQGRCQHHHEAGKEAQP